MTQGFPQSPAVVWSIARQISGAGAGATPLGLLPGSPYRVGRMERLRAALFTISGAGLALSFLGTLVIPLGKFVISNVGFDLPGPWTSQPSEEWLAVIPVVSLLVFLAVYGCIRRLPGARLLLMAWLAAFGITIVAPLVAVYLLVAENPSIYVVIGVFGALVWLGAVVVHNQSHIYRHGSSERYFRRRWSELLMLLVFACSAVGWGALLAEGSVPALDWVLDMLPWGTTTEDGAGSVGGNGAQDALVLGTFFWWTVATTVVYYWFYSRSRCRSRQVDAVVRNATMIVRSAVVEAHLAGSWGEKNQTRERWMVRQGRAIWSRLFVSKLERLSKRCGRKLWSRLIRSRVGLSATHVGERWLTRPSRAIWSRLFVSKRERLLKRCGRKLGSRLIRSQVGFLATYVVTATSSSQDDARLRGAKITSLVEESLVRGIRCGADHHRSDARRRSSIGLDIIAIGKVRNAHKPVVFQGVVFTLAEHLSLILKSTSNPRKNALPRPAAVAARTLAEQIADAICDSGIHALIADRLDNSGLGNAQP